ncbi:MAG: HD domain-containing protein [Deltaproteobacteria bacterium]|nr:HD domain-containing protein [Deltaproteobacteria bacterium]
MRTHEESTRASLRLEFPVCTPDKRLQMPAGTVLSSRNLNGIISANRAASQTNRPLFKHATIKRDLLHQLKRPPYDLIFSKAPRVREVISMLENFQLPVQVLEMLDCFKTANYYTYCHLLRVFTLSALIARQLLPDDRQWLSFVSTGPTHDIGKICVPLHLLKKETPLTRAERSNLDHHTTAGYVLLSCFYQDQRHLATIVARDHHERRDGSGIPRGIQLRPIMVETVIVCDIYDALISSRSYRPDPYDNRTALEEITGLAEMRKIGWKAVRALVALNRKIRPRDGDITLSIEKRGTPPARNCYGVFANGENDGTWVEKFS